MTPREAEARVRHRLDNWRLWVGVAYFGLAAVVVALFFINQRTERTLVFQERAVAVHAASIIAGANAQYRQCMAVIPETRKINAFVRGVRIVHHTLLANSEAALAKTPRSSALYPVRLASLRRLRVAAGATDNVHFKVPTAAQCTMTRKRLLKQA